MSNDAMTRKAIDQIVFARGYVRMFVDDLRPVDWFWEPKEGVTHIAWQIGHLAVAQYSLALKRIRGERPDDEAMISTTFRQQYGKGSTPQPVDQNPTSDEVSAVWDRVHQQVLDELPEYDDERLAVDCDPPHPAFKTKLGSLIWCSQHEFSHAGQIGLLRRLMGKEPLR